MKRAYEKPILVKENIMKFPLQIIDKANKKVVCKQCSGCHGCR